MAIRYRPSRAAKPELVHTLNGSGLALARTVAAIIETYGPAEHGVEVLPYGTIPSPVGREQRAGELMTDYPTPLPPPPPPDVGPFAAPPPDQTPPLGPWQPPTDQQTGPAPGIAFAPHGPRLIAYIVDVLILSFELDPFSCWPWCWARPRCSSGGGASRSCPRGCDADRRRDRDHLLPVVLVPWRPDTRHEAVLTGRRAGRGRRADHGAQAGLRLFGYWINAIAFYIGFAWILIDQRRAAGTTSSPRPASSIDLGDLPDRPAAAGVAGAGGPGPLTGTRHPLRGPRCTAARLHRRRSSCSP